MAFPTKNSVCGRFSSLPPAPPPPRKRKFDFYCRLAVSDKPIVPEGLEPDHPEFGLLSPSILGILHPAWTPCPKANHRPENRWPSRNVGGNVSISEQQGSTHANPEFVLNSWDVKFTLWHQKWILPEARTRQKLRYGNHSNSKTISWSPP